MPDKDKRKRGKSGNGHDKGKGEGKNEAEVVRPHAFWSGTIAFGLVSLPVSLFPANRGRSVSLKMVDKNGTPLARRYFCEKDQQALTRDDIVRGYEIEKDRFVVVKDEELEALAPEKSREIDLRRFVALADINPMYFERAYFLTPDEGATKAYRLLAKSMEDEQRAGIATFVMRGKEYLIAILAEKGILRAETLRFHDEVRSPEDIGLPEFDDAEETRVNEMQQAMQALAAKELDRRDLSDDYAHRIEALAKKKLKAGKDVVKAPEEIVEDYEEETNVIDLMQVLKERLQGRTSGEKKTHKEPARKPASKGHGSSRSRRTDKSELAALSKDELYRRAQDMDVPGRSRMSKKALAEALSKLQ